MNMYKTHNVDTLHKIRGATCEYTLQRNQVHATLHVEVTGTDYTDTYNSKTTLNTGEQEDHDMKTLQGMATITQITYVKAGQIARITDITLFDEEKHTKYNISSEGITIHDYKDNSIHKYGEAGLYSEYHDKPCRHWRI